MMTETVYMARVTMEGVPQLPNNNSNNISRYPGAESTGVPNFPVASKSAGHIRVHHQQQQQQQKKPAVAQHRPASVGPGIPVNNSGTDASAVPIKVGIAGQMPNARTSARDFIAHNGLPPGRRSVPNTRYIPNNAAKSEASNSSNSHTYQQMYNHVMYRHQAQLVAARMPAPQPPSRLWQHSKPGNR
ncbi:unnamed protein product, partial [Notodromas monacha]